MMAALGFPQNIMAVQVCSTYYYDCTVCSSSPLVVRWQKAQIDGGESLIEATTTIVSFAKHGDARIYVLGNTHAYG